MEKAIKKDRPYAEILSYDLRFHSRIVHYCNNVELTRLFDSYNHQLFDIAMKTFSHSDRPSLALEEHKEIYRSIVSDDISSDAEVYRSVINHLKKREKLQSESLVSRCSFRLIISALCTEPPLAIILPMVGP